MNQRSELAAGSYGLPGVCEPVEICGHLVFLLPTRTVPVTDPAALARGFCPDCHVRLAGETGTWCPQCLTYWHERAAAPGPASCAAAGMPVPRPRGGGRVASEHA
jgi:hypothetical protein